MKITVVEADETKLIEKPASTVVEILRAVREATADTEAHEAAAAITLLADLLAALGDDALVSEQALLDALMTSPEVDAILAEADLNAERLLEMIAVYPAVRTPGDGPSGLGDPRLMDGNAEEDLTFTPEEVAEYDQQYEIHRWLAGYGEKPAFVSSKLSREDALLLFDFEDTAAARKSFLSEYGAHDDKGNPLTPSDGNEEPGSTSADKGWFAGFWDAIAGALGSFVDAVVHAVEVVVDVAVSFAGAVADFFVATWNWLTGSHDEAGAEKGSPSDSETDGAEGDDGGDGDEASGDETDPEDDEPDDAGDEEGEGDKESLTEPDQGGGSAAGYETFVAKRDRSDDNHGGTSQPGSDDQDNDSEAVPEDDPLQPLINPGSPGVDGGPHDPDSAFKFFDPEDLLGLSPLTQPDPNDVPGNPDLPPDDNREGWRFVEMPGPELGTGEGSFAQDAFGKIDNFDF
ncbi:MAG: hypothetical protein AAF416_04685 [Pseudomonadota bacterium]